MNWLTRLLSPPGRAIQCPRCQSVGCEHRGPIVIPYDNGSQKEVGELYGCVHCGLAWFTQDGAVKLFGHLKGTLALHPMQMTPERLQTRDRDETPTRDGDLKWR